MGMDMDRSFVERAQHGMELPSRALSYGSVLGERSVIRQRIQRIENEIGPVERICLKHPAPVGPNNPHSRKAGRVWNGITCHK